MILDQNKAFRSFENNIVNFNDSNKYLIIGDDATYVPDMIEN